MDRIRSLIRDVPDFPKPGILFKDITPVLQDPQAFARITELMCDRLRELKVDCVAGIESRGFIFGAPIAVALGVPLVLVRKKGKLPWRTVSQDYDLEYGNATIQVHEDAVSAGQRVAIIDDLLATGGTAAAATTLLRRLDVDVVEALFLIELSFLQGAAKVGAPTWSLLQY